jgi:hypothetical protein
MEVLEASESWHYPLFDVCNLHRYVANLLCPCFAIGKINRHVGGFPLQCNEEDCMLSCACNGPACWIPCCLSVNEGLRFWRGGPKQQESYFDIFQDDAEGRGHSLQETAEAALPLLNAMPWAGGEHDDPAFDRRVAEGMQALTCASVALGVCCIVPTTFLLRRKTQDKFEFHTKEPMWRTGLISCCAWPCAMTQILEECERYDH